tara:strand:+ start:551 stop:1030 length:480 start_codon:yes stop_codon:yes gene_type:complete
MTDKKRLIQDVLGGLKVPKKQTRQQKKSMKRSEKNIKKNLYDDVLKPLKNSGGGLTEGIKKVKAKTKSMLSGGQAKLDKNKNNKIDAEDFKLLREGMALGGSMTRQMTQDMIARAFPKVKGQKQKEEEMYMREKAKYDKPQNMRGGGIAIKGTKFKGVF